jgi:hypothetical protein
MLRFYLNKSQQGNLMGTTIVVVPNDSCQDESDVSSRGSDSQFHLERKHIIQVVGSGQLFTETPIVAEVGYSHFKAIDSTRLLPNAVSLGGRNVVVKRSKHSSAPYIVHEQFH